MVITAIRGFTHPSCLIWYSAVGSAWSAQKIGSEMDEELVRFRCTECHANNEVRKTSGEWVGCVLREWTLALLNSASIFTKQGAQSAKCVARRMKG